MPYLQLNLALYILIAMFPPRNLAGSQTWESPNSTFSIENMDPDTVGRWFRIIGDQNLQVGGLSNPTRRWPKSTIVYCFDNAQAQDHLDPLIQPAMRLWYAAALPDSFKLREGDNRQCQPANEGDVLTIILDNAFSTTVGKVPKSNINPRGPIMRLTDREDIGMLDPLANVAHELGHAWGLYHEHQRPEFWDGDYQASSTVVPGTQIFTFNCENLEDYAEKTAGKSQADIQKMCHEYPAALAAGFSAVEFLPFIPGFGEGPELQSFEATDADVDWESIMLYPSGAGGKRTGGGTVTPENDNRAPVIVRLSDGQSIPVRKSPSPQDVGALRGLYASEQEGRTLPNQPLLTDPRNKKNNRFRTLLSKGRDKLTGGKPNAKEGSVEMAIDVLTV